MTVYAFVDESGVERLRGTIDPTPGGSTPVSATYDGDPVTITDGNFAALTFDRLDDGSALLDITTPAAATFVASGTYAITAQVNATAPLTSGGYCGVFLSATGNVAAGEGAHPDQYAVTLAATVIATAGDACVVYTFNNDGAASRDFSLGAARIVKLA